MKKKRKHEGVSGYFPLRRGEFIFLFFFIYTSWGNLTTKEIISLGRLIKREITINALDGWAITSTELDNFLLRKGSFFFIFEKENYRVFSDSSFFSSFRVWIIFSLYIFLRIFKKRRKICIIQWFRSISH